MLRASAEIKLWAKQNSKYRFPRRWHLNKRRLCLKSQSYVHYTGKGWHVFVLMGFLTHYTERLNLDNDLKMLVWTGHRLMSFLHTKRQESLLLTQESIEQVEVLGNYHLHMFLQCHLRYRNFPTYKLFNVRPKFHMMVHVLEYAQTSRNPISAACWMEEDWVRSVANLAKRTHSKATQLTTLMRYAAGPPDRLAMVDIFHIPFVCWPSQDSSNALRRKRPAAHGLTYRLLSFLNVISFLQVLKRVRAATDTKASEPV